MGLDLTLYEPRQDVFGRPIKDEPIEDFHPGSYSGFGDFRKYLALSVGIVLGDMFGFGGATEWDSVDPYVELLDHSDCDGDIGWYAFEELLKDFTPENRELFIKTVGSDGDAEYYLRKWDMWKHIAERCIEVKGIVRFH